MESALVHPVETGFVAAEEMVFGAFGKGRKSFGDAVAFVAVCRLVDRLDASG